MSEPTFRAHPQVILTELNDGTGVLLHLETKFFFTANETAIALWKELGSGATRAELVQAVCACYEAERAAVEADVDALLAALAAESLILRSE